MIEKKETVLARNLGGHEVVVNSSFVQSVIHKTRRAVSKASLFLGLLAVTPSFAACALPPEAACNDVEPEARPLDRFFNEFDIRDVPPLAEGARSKLEMVKLRAVDLPVILGPRFRSVTGLDVDINKIFQFSERVFGEEAANRIIFVEDLSAFRAELQGVDEQASLTLLQANIVEFQVNGRTHKLEIDWDLGILRLLVDGVRYEWRHYDAQEHGILSEVYETPERRYINSFDASGGGLQRIVENKPLGEPAKDLELNAIDLGGEVKPINDLSDLLEYSKKLKAANLLREVDYAHFIPSRIRGGDFAALKTLIEIYPSDDPAMIQAIWGDLLSDERGICNTSGFMSPNHTIDTGLGSEEAFVTLNALWARMNGYKTELYDIRTVEDGVISTEAGATYILYASNSQTGKYWLMNRTSSQSLEAGVTVQNLVDESNKSMQGSGVQLKIVGRVNF